MMKLDERLFENDNEIMNNEPQLILTGLSATLMDLLKSRLDQVQNLGGFKLQLTSPEVKDYVDPAFCDVIDNIIESDNKHIGELQTLLKEISDSASNIDIGEEEAEEILN